MNYKVRDMTYKTHRVTIYNQFQVFFFLLTISKL